MTERVKWLQTAAHIFELMFKGDDGEISVERKETGERKEIHPRPITGD